MIEKSLFFSISYIYDSILKKKATYIYVFYTTNNLFIPTLFKI